MVTPPRRHLLLWDRPLLPQAVEWLTADWSGEGPLDLSARLIVVPTRQTGRRLREALAATAGQRGQAVFPPLVLTPDALVAPVAENTGIATRAEMLLAWATVLREISLDDFREVFPVDPPTRDFAWARRLAGQMMRLQAALAEAALRIGGVVARAGDDFPEVARWTQLTELERRCDRLLSERGLREPQMAKIAAARTAEPPAGIRDIVWLAVPDPLPLAMIALERLAVKLPVEVVCYGPEIAVFDPWGRPLEAVWAGRLPVWSDVEQHVHLSAGPAEQAEKIVALAQQHARPEGVLAVGVADDEVLARLESGLEQVGVPVFNPAGRSRRGDGLHALLAALTNFVREQSFAHAAALLRCPDVIEWLRRRDGETFSAARMLAQLDELHARHLPGTLATAARRAEEHPQRFPVVGAACAALTELGANLAQENFADGAAAGLGTIFSGRRIDSVSALAEAATVWREVVRETAAALAKFPGATTAEVWELALEAYAAQERFGEKPPGAIELNGWLELLWEDAPQLVVAGVNEGRVPEAVTGDVFLPETLRGRLGLKTNAMRFARDAYLLDSLAAWREREGRLDVIVGRTSAAGDPLRPSRLLMRCADEQLPARVEFLFREPGAGRAGPAWTRAWQLQPRIVAAPAAVSVTALRGWLECPFRFYLRHVLRAERVEPDKTELDALDFGTLVHAALQAMGEDEKLRDCTDEAVLRTALLGEFDRRARVQFGDSPALPLLAQFGSARQRLVAVARVQARERAAGWRIDRVEWKFELAFGAMKVRGKIDRVDRHVETGGWRVLDYKTSDKAAAPADAHLGPVRSADELKPEWARTLASGKARAWRDLQLPLYRKAMAAEVGVLPACGYFNLPKAAGETAVSAWADFPDELQAAADACAAGVMAQIAAGNFWPPAEKSGREEELDPYAELFHRGAVESVRFGKEGVA